MKHDFKNDPRHRFSAEQREEANKWVRKEFAYYITGNDDYGTVEWTGPRNKAGRPYFDKPGITIARLMAIHMGMNPSFKTRHLCGDGSCFDAHCLTYGTQSENEFDKPEQARKEASRKGLAAIKARDAYLKAASKDDIASVPSDKE
jgi:hypothetical protein